MLELIADKSKPWLFVPYPRAMEEYDPSKRILLCMSAANVVAPGCGLLQCQQRLDLMDGDFENSGTFAPKATQSRRSKVGKQKIYR